MDVPQARRSHDVDATITAQHRRHVGSSVGGCLPQSWYRHNEHGSFHSVQPGKDCREGSHGADESRVLERVFRDFQEAASRRVKTLYGVFTIFHSSQEKEEL